MNRELYVSSTPHETRLALAEDGEIAEVYYEREKEYSLAGSIYKGRVTRVLPGMQSAFVDIGLERDAFLYVSDFFEDSEEYDRVVSEAETAAEKLERPAGESSRAETEAGQSGGAEAGANAAAAPGPMRGDGDSRGGRQRLRSRRGRSGFPEAKFARPEEAAAPPEPPLGEEAAPPAHDVNAAPPQAAALVLPGESLAKYRHPAAAEPQPPIAATGSERVAPVARFEPPAPAARAAAGFVLPGESLAKYRNARPAVNAEAAPEPEPEPASVLAMEAAEEDNETFTERAARDEFEVERSQPDSPTEAAAPARESVVPTDVDDTDAATESERDAAGSETEGEADAEPDASAALRQSGGEARMQNPGAAPLEDANRNDRRGRGRRRRRGRGTDRTPAGGEAGFAGEPPLPPARPPAREGRGESNGKNESSRQIGDLLREGQEILIQIAKEPLGKKGARITSHLALPGRYLVYMPTVHHVGVSRKIASDEERARLKRLILENSQDLPGGFIVRTAGAGAGDEEFKADIRLLANQWNDIREQFERSRSPALLHHDLNLVERTLRDHLSNDFTHIWVDTDELYQRIVKFVSFFMPHLVDRVRLYTREAPLFEHFGIQEEINKALKSKVWLKSGGYIVLNQTEALVAIDVNTGKYVGKSNRLEDTIVKTNVDAIKEIVRQIRLRDLGGIIVIDFIDMDERRNRQRVMQALEEAMRADRAPNKILSFNDFGLVALTRKRVKQSLERTLGSACPYCSGVGLVKSPVTVCNEIYNEVRKAAPSIERDDVVLRVHPEVARMLKGQNAQRLRELEEVTRKAISVRPDPQVHQEQFEIY